MAEKKELISEENYQKWKGVIRKIRISLWVFGGFLALIGIILLIVSATKKTPSMGSNGWFESESTKNGLLFGGIACLIFGIFISVAGAMTFAISHRREMLAFGANAVLPVADELVDKGAPVIEKASKSIGKGLGSVVGGVKEGWTGESNTIECPDCKTENSKRNKYCKNCGKLLPKGSFCPSCGKKVESDSKFCPRCGGKIEEK